MPGLAALVALLHLASKGRTQLVLENVALRHQPAIYKRSVGRPNITDRDRFFWLTVTRMLRGWRDALVIVQPATVSLDGPGNQTAVVDSEVPAGDSTGVAVIDSAGVAETVPDTLLAVDTTTVDTLVADTTTVDTLAVDTIAAETPMVDTTASIDTTLVTGSR